jgi:hypothetical protein
VYLADLAQWLGMPEASTEEELIARARQITAAQSRIAAAAPPTDLSRPWGTGNPVAWAEATDRITASSAGFWQAKHREAPAEVEATLIQLTPVPRSLLAASLPVVDLLEEAYEAMFAGVPTSGAPAAGTRRTSASYQPPPVIAGPAPTDFRNAVEELRSTHPQLVAAAERGVPAPSMFSGGDYPTSTASGLSPTALYGLPWRARLAAAWEPDLAQAHRIVEECAAGDPWGLEQSLAGSPAVRDYVAQVRAWAATSGVNAE